MYRIMTAMTSKRRKKYFYLCYGEIEAQRRIYSVCGLFASSTAWEPFFQQILHYDYSQEEVWFLGSARFRTYVGGRSVQSGAWGPFVAHDLIFVTPKCSSRMAQICFGSNFIFNQIKPGYCHHFFTVENLKYKFSTVYKFLYFFNLACIISRVTFIQRLSLKSRLCCT